MNDHYRVVLVLAVLGWVFLTATEKSADTFIKPEIRRIRAEALLKSFDYSPEEIAKILSTKTKENRP